jgi:hypothetical protein
VRRWCRRISGFRYRLRYVGSAPRDFGPRRPCSAGKPYNRLRHSVLERAHREHEWDPGY